MGQVVRLDEYRDDENMTEVCLNRWYHMNVEYHAKKKANGNIRTFIGLVVFCIAAGWVLL